MLKNWLLLIYVCCPAHVWYNVPILISIYTLVVPPLMSIVYLLKFLSPIYIADVVNFGLCSPSLPAPIEILYAAASKPPSGDKTDVKLACTGLVIIFSLLSYSGRESRFGKVKRHVDKEKYKFISFKTLKITCNING